MTKRVDFPLAAAALLNASIRDVAFSFLRTSKDVFQIVLDLVLWPLLFSILSEKSHTVNEKLGPRES